MEGYAIAVYDCGEKYLVANYAKDKLEYPIIFAAAPFLYLP